MAGRSGEEQVRFLREGAGPGAAKTRTTPFSGAALGRLRRRFTEENGRSAGRPSSSRYLPVVMKSMVDSGQTEAAVVDCRHFSGCFALGIAGNDGNIVTPKPRARIRSRHATERDSERGMWGREKGVLLQ